jgi:hypothetical protein
MKKLMYLSKENNPHQKVESLDHCFPMRIEFVSERNIVCLSEFPRIRNVHLFKIGLFK